jgi:hypothetical protein
MLGVSHWVRFSYSVMGRCVSVVVQCGPGFGRHTALGCSEELATATVQSLGMLLPSLCVNMLVRISRTKGASRHGCRQKALHNTISSPTKQKLSKDNMLGHVQ